VEVVTQHRFPATGPARRHRRTRGHTSEPDVRSWPGRSALADLLTELVGSERTGVVAVVILTVDASGQSRRPPVNRTVPPTVLAERRQANRVPPDDAGWERLTERERAVAVLAGRALTNQQIAHRLGISPHTVNYHLRQVFRKLSIDSRVRLARLVGDERPDPPVRPGCRRGGVHGDSTVEQPRRDAAGHDEQEVRGQVGSRRALIRRG
jgi:DNA-binding CsgD family transcriptional regulator